MSSALIQIPENLTMLFKSNDFVINKEMEVIVNFIKLFIKLNKLDILAIYLFGSRARLDFREDSDYDFLIILNDNKTFQEKRKISTELRKFLYNNKILLDLDLVIKNIENWLWESENLGYLSYTVKNEGILL